MLGTAVIGVIFMDIKGFPRGVYSPLGTNPGRVEFLHGGVCRNVAEDMAHLGMPVSFVTIHDASPLGQQAMQRLAAAGVDLRYAVTVPQDGIGIWLAVMDENGDLAGSTSQMPNTHPLSEVIRTRGEEIASSCQNIALEMDLGEAVSEEVVSLARRHGRDLYCIPADMSVILKRPDLLCATRCFICNGIEAGRLFGAPLPHDTPQQILKAVRQEGERLHLGAMVVTLGAQGAVYYDSAAKQSGFCPALPARMVDSTGAGDSFFAGTVSGLTRGLSLPAAVAAGTRLAALTVQSAEASCPTLPDFWEQ